MGEPTENLQGHSVDEVWVEDCALIREEGFRFGERGASSLRTHILNPSRGGDIALAQKFHSGFPVTSYGKT